MRRRIAVFVDADVVARHFLDSGVIGSLAVSHDVILVMPTLGRRKLARSDNPDKWGLQSKTVDVPAMRELWWKRLFYLDQLAWRPGRDWSVLRAAYRTMIGAKAGAILSVLALPGIRSLARMLFRRELAKFPATELGRFLDEVRPDALVHPSIFQGCYINDLMAEAQARSIPFVLLMNSWDNPSLKRGSVGSPDAVVVWGEETARHAEQFMGVEPGRIHRFGAAQFDCFRDPPESDRLQICQEHGLDPALPIIFYAGSSKHNDEYAHLRLLEAAMADGRLERCNILYRPHPFLNDRQQVERILNAEWRHMALEATIRPLFEEILAGGSRGFFSTPYARTHALLAASDVVISPMSTILLEGALHGKPAICLVPEEEDAASPWKVLRRLPCFRDLMESPAVVTVTQLDALLPAVGRAIQESRDPATAARQIRNVEPFITLPERPYAVLLSELIDTILDRS